MIRRNLGFWMATMILILMATLFSSLTVFSRTKLEGREVEAYYLEKENDLKQEIRDFLNANGFTNSGVMLTRVVDADGAREYTITMHHGKLDCMTDAERESLVGDLEELSFDDEKCSFSYEFLLENE